MNENPISRYCSECRNHTRHDCAGKAQDQEAQYVFVEGEKRHVLRSCRDYKHKHGVNFCKLYEFDLRLYSHKGHVAAGVDLNETLDNDQDTGVTPKQNDLPTPSQMSRVRRRKTKIRLKKSATKTKTNAIGSGKIKLKFKTPPVVVESIIDDGDLTIDSSSFDDLLVD